MMTYAERSLQGTAAYNETIKKLQLDVKNTLELVMGDSSAEMLDEMASIFLEDAVPLIAQIKTGFASGEFTTVQMAAHALKGSSATIGLEQFANTCLAIENSIKQNETSLMNQHLAELESKYVQIEKALSDFLL
jgi:HPt (histidine-containing phosphotransfer) domain-containing protein